MYNLAVGRRRPDLGRSFRIEEPPRPGAPTSTRLHKGQSTQGVKGGGDRDTLPATFQPLIALSSARLEPPEAGIVRGRRSL
jgi:hypothetical protein